MTKIYKEAQNLSLHRTINHGFFGRKGGVSEGIYASLNCGFSSHDKPENVQRNREIILQSLETPYITSCYQYHSAKVRVVTEMPKDLEERPYADALVSTVPNLALGVFSADCGCILMFEPQAKIIAAIHAGWKGTLAGIIENTLDSIEKLGGKKSNIFAALGPTISGKNYEIGAEVREQFLQKSLEYSMAFTPSERENHFYFNLPSVIMHKLEKNGIQAENLDICTYQNEDEFFSFRRSTHQKQADYGRQISAIMLKEIA